MRVHPSAQAARGHPRSHVVGCSEAGPSSSDTHVAVADSDGSMGGHAPGSALVASRVGALLRWEVGGTRLEEVVACMVASGPQAST